MTTPSLPHFRYHPDPLGSGSIVVSTASCRCCRRKRGYIYCGSVYAEKDLTDALCPWCIADGSAHERFDATFMDADTFPAELAESVVAEVSQRTPGYNAWQQERWPVCCQDAAAFLAPVGIAEVRARYRDQEMGLLSHIIYEMNISGGAATRLLESLNLADGPTAYLFRCLHCERTLFHLDHL